MKLIDLRCPNCKAALKANEELEKITCNYCGATVYIEDEKQTKAERVIKQIGKEIQKSREYYSSEEYKKKLEIQNEQQKENLKRAGIICLAWLGFMIIMFIIIKLFS